MVENSEGQFYTMEGIAAAVLMVLTAYLVMSTTSVYTPGDTHIIDMQLEQIGNDALKILDTKNTPSDDLTELEHFIWDGNSSGFDETLNHLLNFNSSDINPIKYKADIYYIDSIGNVSPPLEFLSATRYMGDVNAVSVSRWVFIPKNSPYPPLRKDRTQTVLLEVLLWRD